jgi:hypothetical protein
MQLRACFDNIGHDILCGAGAAHEDPRFIRAECLNHWVFERKPAAGRRRFVADFWYVWERFRGDL